MSQDAMEYLKTAVGDLEELNTKKIEAEVNNNKKELKPAVEAE
jgi:hypothetical protein